MLMHLKHMKKKELIRSVKAKRLKRGFKKEILGNDTKTNKIKKFLDDKGICGKGCYTFNFK